MAAATRRLSESHDATRRHNESRDATQPFNGDDAGPHDAAAATHRPGEPRDAARRRLESHDATHPLNDDDAGPNADVGALCMRSRAQRRRPGRTARLSARITREERGKGLQRVVDLVEPRL